MTIPPEEMLLRLGVHGRPAGLRTHFLVSLASTTFMLVSTQFVFFQLYGKDDLVNVDTSRIAASVVSGVGFLGAGAILRTGWGIQGLTTAASMWLTSAIGLAAGGGMYVVAVASTVAALICLVILRRFEGKHQRWLPRRVMLVLAGERSSQEVMDVLRKAGAEVSDVGYDLQVKANRTRLSVDILVPNAATVETVTTQLEKLPGLKRVKVLQH
jgi:putative Mg2+ transporter-C (MgtC) family protein